MKGLLHSFVALFLCASFALGAQQDIPSDVAKSAFEAAAEVLTTYPPERYYIVGLGTNSSPIASAMRVLIGDPKLLENYLMEIPVEGYRTHIPETSPHKIRAAWDRILPSPTELQGREPVLLRVLLGGITIDRMGRDVKNHIRVAQDISNSESNRENQKIHAYFVAFSEQFDSRVFSDDGFHEFFGGKVTFNFEQSLPSFTLDSEGTNRLARFSSYVPFTAHELAEKSATELWRPNPFVSETDAAMAELMPVPPPITKHKLQKIRDALKTIGGESYSMARRSYLTQYAGGKNCGYALLAK